MTHPNVPAPEVKSEPDPFAELAAELHRVAVDVSDLIGSGLPAPAQFMLNIQPGAPLSSRNDDGTAAAVDAMAGALLGIHGKVEKMGDGSYFYCTDNQKRGPLVVTIYQGVSTEWALRHDVAAAKAELAEREAELEKARARVAELEKARKPLVSDELLNATPATWNEREGRWDYADETGLAYTRADTDADDPTPVSPARVPLHTGSVVDGDKLITDPETVTVYFSFGHGQTDPDTGENLLDKYVTIVGPTYEACRAAMFASRYSNRWSFDYIAGTPTANEWIPRWAEHERIDATTVRTDTGGCE